MHVAIKIVLTSVNLKFHKTVFVICSPIKYDLKYSCVIILKTKVCADSRQGRLIEE